MSPEKDKRFTEDFVRKWSRAGEVRKKKQVSKNERILKNQEEILKRNPRNHKIWFARGTLLVEMGRHEEAIRCFDAVIKLDPKNRAVYNAKASALMRMGDTDEAVKWYRKALAVTSEDVDRKLTETLSEEAPVEEILRQMSEESKEWEVKVETRTCPICGATVKKETKICPSCDWEFYDEELEKKVFAEEEVKPERELTEEEMRERLIQKVDTFRMQGFEVGPLVRTIRTEPHRARSATEQFEENVEKVKEYRKQLEGMDTTRFESRVKELEALFRSPYNIFVIRKEFDKLVSRVKARRARKAPPSKVSLERKPPAVGLTNGRRGRVNGLVKDRKAIGLTNGRTGRVNGLVNGRGRVNGITNGLGMVNGITNGLTYRFQTMKTGLVNGLTNGNGITNGLGSIRFRNESKMRRWKVAVIPIVAFTLLTLPFLFVSEVPISDIEIDGRFDDWSMAPKIPSTPDGSLNDNIDILYEAAWRNHRFISLYVEVANIALWGNPATSSPDTFHALLDVDNDIETGYVVRGIGADYMVRIRGYGGNVLSSQLHRYGSESDQVNWSSWQKVGNVKSAVSLKSLETQVPLSSLEATGPRIAVLFHTQGYDNLYDFSDHIISGQGGVLEIDQRWSDTIRTISGASNRILDIYARAIGRDVYLDSLTIHLMGDAELSEIDMLRLSMDGLDIATISPPFTSRDQTFQFSSKRIGEGGTAVLSVDTTVIGSSENTLAAKVSSSGDVGMITGIASLKTVIPTGYMGYVGNYPSQVEIDGGFHEWTAYDTDPQDQVNPNIDIVRFASVRINATQLLVHTYFYLNVAGVMAGGSLVPYTSPGPVKEQAYAPDSDRDTVPDSIDPYDHDFNNNMIPDSQTNFDVDEDMVQDYPRGPDCWLETVLQDFFPDPYKGREVRVNICPSAPSRVTGEDYVNIFIDIDGDVKGYAVGPIFADYLLQITGKNNDITSKEFLKYKSQGPLEWEPIGSAPDVDWDTQRLEAHVEITGRTFDMFEVFFEASDWKDLTDDATDVTRGGRSVSEGSFGDFDARFSSPSYESYFTDQADKVSFRRRSNYITWSLPKEIRLEDGTDSRVVGELEPSYLTMDDNGAVYPNAYSGVDVSIEYIFEDTKLKENIVLEKAFEDMTEGGVISLSSRLEYSETLVVYAEGEESEEWTVVSGGLTFLERDSARFHISLPYAVDSQGDILDCRYLFNAKEGLLDLHCPTDWFLTATYPVKIDPSVTTYTIENDGTLGQATEYFGWSVAIGDFDNDGYADVATGAPWADVGS
ncbi:MAG: tetratricopeptide repeat protein, partial [Methanomassiliicoccales archaeon]